MHLAARSGNEAVLLAVVEKIGAGAVQIVQNKQSKVDFLLQCTCLNIIILFVDSHYILRWRKMLNFLFMENEIFKCENYCRVDHQWYFYMLKS